MKGQGKAEDIFERQWREAFEGAEQAPPRIVWSEIDRTMANERALVYKKKTVYYRWAAAAIFLLATSIGLLQMIGDQSYNERSILAIQIDNPQQQERYYTQGLNDWVKECGPGQMPPINRLANTMSGGGDGNHGNSSLSAMDLMSGGSEPPSLDDGGLSAPEMDRIEPTLAFTSVDLVDYIYRVADYGNSKSKRRSAKSEGKRYWAGVDVNSGSFDPNFQSTAGVLNNSLDFNQGTEFSAFNTEALDANSPVVRENMQSGQSLAYGVNLGVKLSDRWTLQSGFQYMKAGATNNTNVVVTSTRLVEPIAATSQIKNVAQVRTAVQADEVVEYNYQDVDLNNEFQFATIPVKAGYRVLDSKFSLELKAGVAANLYLGNKLTDPNNKIADVTIGPGSNSPYKEVSFLGLAGIQFGYEFIRRFNFVIEPNYRRSLDSFTKDSSEFVASPSGFGLQTGIRYQFN